MIKYFWLKFSFNYKNFHNLIFYLEQVNYSLINCFPILLFLESYYASLAFNKHSNDNNYKVIFVCANKTRVDDVCELLNKFYQPTFNPNMRKKIVIQYDEAHNKMNGVPIYRSYIENLFSVRCFKIIWLKLSFKLMPLPLISAFAWNFPRK